MTQKSRALVLSSVALLALAFGCEDKPKETKSAAPDAGAGQNPAVDPNLAEAVAAAGSKAPQADASAGDGPPPNGIFEPGKADLQQKLGDAPKVALGEAGAEPRQVLGGSVTPGWRQSGTFEVTLRLGRAQLPGLAISLNIEAQKPKAPAAGLAAPAPAAEPAAVDGAPFSAKVSDIKLTSDVGPQGKELLVQLSKMKGSRIDFRVLSVGVGVDFKTELVKGAPADLEMVLRAVSEALESSAVGFPKEPVGAGGYWLVTTRGAAGGADVVSYQLVKLEKVDGDRLTLNVSTKRYSASTKLQVAGLPPGAELDQFQSTTEAKLTLVKGQPLANSGTTKQTFAAALIPAGGGDQRLAVQSVADVTLTLGKQ